MLSPKITSFLQALEWNWPPKHTVVRCDWVGTCGSCSGNHKEFSSVEQRHIKGGKSFLYCVASRDKSCLRFWGLFSNTSTRKQLLLAAANAGRQCWQQLYELHLALKILSFFSGIFESKQVSSCGGLQPQHEEKGTTKCIVNINRLQSF